MPVFVVNALGASADSIMLAAYGRNATEFRKLLELAQQEPQNSIFVCISVILVLLAGWFTVRVVQRFAETRGFPLTAKLLKPITDLSEKLGSIAQRSLGPFKSVVLSSPGLLTEAGAKKVD